MEKIIYQWVRFRKFIGYKIAGVPNHERYCHEEYDKKKVDRAFEYMTKVLYWEEFESNYGKKSDK